jgi:hypothetical protein
MKRNGFLNPRSRIGFGPTRFGECAGLSVFFRKAGAIISKSGAPERKTLNRGYRCERVFIKIERFAIVLSIFWLTACVSASDTTGENAALDSNQTRSSRRADSGTIGTSRKPTSREYKIIRRLMVETEQVRGLKFVRPVPVVIQDREAITAHIESEIEDSDLERARTVYTALGLLDPDLDIKSLLLRVLGEQILGYYDPDDNRLVVRDDIIRTIRTDRDDSFYPIVDEARIDLVHELVHALQSQHLALRENMERERDNDAENAFRALIEGDATLAMIGYLIKKQQPDARLRQLTGNPLWIRSIASMINQMPMAGPELANAPPIVSVPLLSAYVDGLAFVANLHGRGGWRAIDLAHRSPPTSTEQVLHPERFLQGDTPQTTIIPKIPALKKAGYKLVEEDTLGELEIRIYFAQGVSDKTAERAAEGWSWDRLRLYRKESGEKAVIWFTTWDDETEAKEAEAAARRALDRVVKSKRALYEVARNHTTVLIIRGLPKHLQREVLDVWSSWKAILLSTRASGGEV